MSSARASSENQCSKYSPLGISHLKRESLYFIRIDAPVGSGFVRLPLCLLFSFHSSMGGSTLLGVLLSLLICSCSLFISFFHSINLSLIAIHRTVSEYVFNYVLHLVNNLLFLALNSKSRAMDCFCISVIKIRKEGDQEGREAGRKEGGSEEEKKEREEEGRREYVGKKKIQK